MKETVKTVLDSISDEDIKRYLENRRLQNLSSKNEKLRALEKDVKKTDILQRLYGYNINVTGAVTVRGRIEFDITDKGIFATLNNFVCNPEYLLKGQIDKASKVFQQAWWELSSLAEVHGINLSEYVSGKLSANDFLFMLETGDD